MVIANKTRTKNLFEIKSSFGEIFLRIADRLPTSVRSSGSDEIVDAMILGLIASNVKYTDEMHESFEEYSARTIVQHIETSIERSRRLIFLEHRIAPKNIDDIDVEIDDEGYQSRVLTISNELEKDKENITGVLNAVHGHILSPRPSLTNYCVLRFVYSIDQRLAARIMRIEGLGDEKLEQVARMMWGYACSADTLRSLLGARTNSEPPESFESDLTLSRAKVLSKLRHIGGELGVELASNQESHEKYLNKFNRLYASITKHRPGALG